MRTAAVKSIISILRSCLGGVWSATSHPPRWLRLTTSLVFEPRVRPRVCIHLSSLPSMQAHLNGELPASTELNGGAGGAAAVIKERPLGDLGRKRQQLSVISGPSTLAIHLQVRATPRLLSSTNISMECDQGYFDVAHASPPDLENVREIGHTSSDSRQPSPPATGFGVLISI